MSTRNNSEQNESLKDFYVIILPFFNEGKVLQELIKQICENISDESENFILLFVNDGSTDDSQNILNNITFNQKNIALKSIELESNHGHQNAIRQGLIYVKQNYFLGLKGLIIMDSDGEDNPEAIKELTKKENFDIVFVVRGKRRESITFKLGYFAYKIIFKLITGKQINFGNYSMISKNVLNSIAEKNFFHYSAFLSKHKFKIENIKFDRNKRIDGKSKMGYKNLLLHAIKSLIEYYEDLIIFQIKVFVLILMFFSGILGYVIYSKYIAHTAILGWPSSLLIGLINGLLIIFSSIVLSSLIMTVKNNLDQNNIKLK
jgi:glycosyltransferase involved in cell wall biosynthesis